MLLLTSIVSVCVAMSLIWIGFVVSCIMHNTFDGSYIIALMGLFLPFVVIGFGIAFVYLFTEIKKIQDLLQKFSKKAPVLTYQELPEEKEKQPIISISMDEPISKYEDVNLPENIDLRFEK